MKKDTSLSKIKFALLRLKTTDWCPSSLLVNTALEVLVRPITNQAKKIKSKELKGRREEMNVVKMSLLHRARPSISNGNFKIFHFKKQKT